MCLIQFKNATGVEPQSLLLNNERLMLPDRETRQACLSIKCHTANYIHQRRACVCVLLLLLYNLCSSWILVWVLFFVIQVK